MKVKELMTKNVGFCHPEDKLPNAVEIMRQKNCGVVPVVDEHEKVVGMITDRDICLSFCGRKY